MIWRAGLVLLNGLFTVVDFLLTAGVDGIVLLPAAVPVSDWEVVVVVEVDSVPVVCSDNAVSVSVVLTLLSVTYNQNDKVKLFPVIV